MKQSHKLFDSFHINLLSFRELLFSLSLSLSYPLSSFQVFLLTFWSAASKNDGLDGDSLWGFPLWVDDGALAGRSAEAGVGMSAGFAWGGRRDGKVRTSHSSLHSPALLSLLP